MVGSALPQLDGQLRAVAERADGRRAVMEAGAFGGANILAFLDEFVEEIEQWGDTGAFLPILAGGRVAGSKVVVRIIEAPRGQVLTTRRGRQGLTVHRAVNAALSLATAVAAAHARGLVHGSLVSGRVHLLANGVEVEPGGLAGGLAAAGGGVPPRRSDDVRAIAELLIEMLTGEPDAGVPEGLPDGLGGMVREALSPDPSRRPTAAEMVGVLRQVSSQLTPMSASEASTPATVNRTVSPRLGVVDVTLLPAAPPAPEVRSLAPAADREIAAPLIAPAERARRRWEVAAGLVVLVLSALVAWWMLA